MTDNALTGHRPVTPLTLAAFLLGRRDAILHLAECRGTLWLGAAFVLSAGFAREYDGEDLLGEPWHLLIPFAASLVTSLALFALVYGLLRRRGEDAGRFRDLYRRFLGLYWMTAPLAWLYAIPVERFLTAGEATRANLWLLAIVSVWRVALMIRVLCVLFSAAPAGAAWLVLTFADAVAFAAISLVPTPVIAFMGGVRLSESEQLIQSTTVSVCILTIITAPVWLVGLTVVFGRSQPLWRLAFDLTAMRPVHISTFVIAAAGIAGWAAVLPRTQPEQRLRRQVERALNRGDIAAGLALMSQHQPSDFPPLWDPPPRVAYARPLPSILDVMEVVVRQPTAEWVRQVYSAKLSDMFADPYGDGFSMYFNDLSDRDAERFVAMMEALPEKRAVLEKVRAGDHLGWTGERTVKAELARRLLELPPPKPAARAEPPAGDSSLPVQ